MKKILAVSLGALLVVGAANAEIASVEYVTDELANKQNTISDLATIRSGAALGATAVQNLGNLGVTATATELNYVDGVTSNIQTQLNSKQASLGYMAENAANKTQAIDANSTATQYPSAKAVKTALDYKVNIKQGTDNAGKGLIVEGTNGTLTLTDIATQEELNAVARTASSGQTAQQVNTAITNAIGGLDVASVGGEGQFVITIKQENGKIDAGVKSFVPNLVDGVLDAPTTNAVYDALALKQDNLGYTAENTANKVTSVTSTSTNTQYPTAKAVYTALSGKQDSLGYTAENAANKVTSVTDTSTDTQYPSAKAVYTAVSGKQNSSLGSTNANKAVITDGSGNITSGTITSAMITNSTIATEDIANSAVTTDKIANNAVTSAKIAAGTIVNSDIADGAAIAQSKISGLTTALNGKQDVAPRDESGNSYFVVTPDGVWKDMFDSMRKDEACGRSDVKCALTHKAGQYVWEVVRE